MKPNFVCIGAQRAGTSWLYKRLLGHPEFSMPPVKEMHYFDRDEDYSTPNKLSVTSAIQRLRNPRYRKLSARRICAPLKSRDFRRAYWWASYSLLNYSDRWYQKLYNLEKGITGDITPSYSILDEKDVSRMHRILPDAQIVFLLRNPVDRAWSSYRYLKELQPDGGMSRYTERLGDEIDFDDIEAIERFINSPFQELRSNYIRTIDLYLKYFDKSRIILGFYDAIKENPQGLLSEILEHIGAKDHEYAEGITNVDNRSVSVSMPLEVRSMLEDKYRQMIGELASRYGHHATTWQLALGGDRAEQADGANRLSPVAHP